MRPSGIHSIVVNTFYSSSARLAAIVARAVYVVVIANQLGPELYGLFNYGMSWYLLFVPLGIIGIDEVMVREIGRHGAAAPAVVDNSLSLRLAAGLGAVVACVALGAGLDGAEPVRALLYVFALALFGRTLSAWSNAVFRGSEASQYLLAQELGFRVLEVVIGLLLLWRGHGLVALAGVHAAGWLLQGVVGVAYVRARFFPRLSLRVERRLLRQLVLAGLPFLAWALLLGWLVQGPVVLGRTAFGDGSALGQLALGAQVFVLVGSVVAELGTAAIPVLTRSAERADGKTRRFAEAALRVAWLLSGLLTIGAIALGDWVLALLFGAAYAPVGPLLPWITLLVGMHFCAQAFWGVLVARAGNAALLGAAASGAAVFSLAFVPAVGALGLHGAFAALVLGYLALLAWQVRALVRSDALDWRTASLRPLLAVGAGLALCLLLLPLGRLLAAAVEVLGLGALSVWLGAPSLEQIRRVLAARSRE